MRRLAEGREYTITDRMLWLLVRRIEENTVVIGKALGNKKLKLPKEHPEYPWSDPTADTSRVQIGARGDIPAEDVMDFLDSF